MPTQPECYIHAFVHCRKCLEEIPEGVSPAEWTDQAVGYTEYGLQVWCNRHECNVAHYDMRGDRLRSGKIKCLVDDHGNPDDFPPIEEASLS